jgi:polysaccharide pyruvyl transferase WcaK-like protein
VKQLAVPIEAVILNDTSANDHYGSRLVMSQIRAHCASVGIHICHSVPRTEAWCDDRHIRHVDRGNCVIVNGEGSMHGPRKNATRLALVADYCRKRNQKCFLINSVYENISQEIAQQVARFDLVYVRESRSKRALAAQGIAAQVAPDISLSYTPTIPEAARRQGLLLTDSVRRDTSTRLFELSRQIADAQFISLRAEQPGRFAVVGDWVSRGVVALAGRYAPEATRKRAKKARHEGPQRSIEVANTLDELLLKLASSQLVITGRFHMVCMAMLTKTPFIALPSNTHKIEGLLEDSGLSHRLAFEDVSPHLITNLARWQPGELAMLATYLSRAKEAIAAMFEALRNETMLAPSSSDPLTLPRYR